MTGKDLLVLHWQQESDKEPLFPPELENTVQALHFISGKAPVQKNHQ